eukprot:1369265-Pyramimonas_sp.AAC.1
MSRTRSPPPNLPGIVCIPSDAPSDPPCSQTVELDIAKPTRIGHLTRAWETSTVYVEDIMGGRTM